MGQKIHPRGFRLGVIDTWQSRWFATREFPKYIGQDIKIRKLVKARLEAAGISRIEIDRAGAEGKDRITIRIHSAKPGLVIGKKGKDIEDLRKDIRVLVEREERRWERKGSERKKEEKAREVAVSIVETRKPDMDAQLVAENIAFQLEKRVNFRRAMKESVGRAQRAGAEGIKVVVGGRLNGAEIARVEKYREGRVPLHTLRADIDYGVAEARTTYGVIGVKVWVFKGEKFSPSETQTLEAMQL